MRLETIGCPVCGCPRYLDAFEVRDRFETIAGRFFSIVRCPDCRLLYLNPRPDAASAPAFYTAEGYDPFVSSRRRRSLLTTAYRFARHFTVRRKAARATRDLAAQGRALDVGCATGEFLVELRRRGFKVCGVEPDPQAADFARIKHGLTVWTGTVQQVPGESGPFDLITLWHVLEHVHDLRGTLARLRELLTASGRLVVAVPNPLSSDACAYGPAWVAWEAPRHLYHFEPAVMLDALARAGFTARRAGPLAFDAFYHCLLSERGGILGLLRAAFRGTVSFARAVAGGEGSSEIYFACKR